MTRLPALFVVLIVSALGVGSWPLAGQRLPVPVSAQPPVVVGGGAVGCVSVPSRCGYPDGSNAGVPAGVVLRSVPGQVSSGPGWHYDPRGWVSVDGDGAVFDGFSTTLNVDVTGSGVTIRNCRVTVAGDSFGVSLRHVRDVTVQDSEIAGPDAGPNRLLVAVKDIYGDSTGTRVLRNNISRASTGVQIDQGLVQGNYIHDLGYQAGDHLNGTTSNGGTALLTLDHNTVLNSFGQTDAISLFEDFGVQANRVISNNLLAGGGYTLYGGANPGGAQTSGIKVVGNRFSRGYFPAGGAYGPVTAFDPAGPGNVWTGNTWDDNGQTLNP